MQTQFKTEQHLRGSLIDSELKAKKAEKLIKEIQSLLAPHGVRAEAVATAFSEILFETSVDRMRESMEEFRVYMLGTVVWKIFGEGSSPWIYPQTMSGNEVPVDLLVAAYLAWKNAMSMAERQGVDSAAAAEAFVNAAHATADRIVSEELHKKIGDVRNAPNYMFRSFMHLIPRIAAKQGTNQIDNLDLSEWLASGDSSDEGAFMEAMENGVFCWELLNAIPPYTKIIAVARHHLGYSWEEIADCLNTSTNAAQKALSAGIRNALGVCMRKLQKMRYDGVLEVEKFLLMKKKRRIRRRPRESHGHR
jgi:hypothetical protein